MTIDSAITKLERALKGFKCPVARLSYEEKAETYITYQMLQAVPAEYADDDYANLTYTFGVVLNAQKDRIIKLLADIIQRLRKEGFTISSIEAESFNTNSGLFSVPIIVKMLEDQ